MANLKDTIIAGALRVTGTIFGNLRGTIDGFTVAKSVPSDAVFTDTVTTVTTTGSGNAITALTASSGALTATKDSTFLTSHQSIYADGITGANNSNNTGKLINRYAACSTEAGTAAKTASITTGTFTLEAGATVAVKFANANTAGTPTLNINSKGAKNIFSNGAQITTGDNKALLKGLCTFIYDGTQWHLIGNYIDTNTTYTANTSKLVTTTVPNVTNKGTTPSLTITSTDCDDITAWTTNTPSTVPTMTASEGVLTFTAGSNGSAASLSYTARSVGSASGWSAGTTPTLGTAITVATGSVNANGSGATVATGITAS